VKLHRGAVVIASLRNLSGKPRPFVVLRSNLFLGNTLVTLLAFTSRLRHAPTLRVTIEPTPDNGLLVTSQAEIDQVQSVAARRIDRVVGQLARADMQAIDHAVAVYLGFADVPRRASAA
jgi:mRNA interferase MazF